MSLWETVGSKMLLCAWQECEASIICKEMLSPSMVGKKNPLTLPKFYETLKMQKEGVRSLPHLVDFNTPKFSAKHRYSLVECLISNVNKQVFGGGGGGGDIGRQSLFSVSKSLHKLDKNLFLQEAVRYMELMMHQKSKDSYGEVIREQFANSVIFSRSHYFKVNTDECVWDEIEPELSSPSLRGSEMSSPETLSAAVGVAGVEKRKRGAVSELSTEGKGIIHIYKNVYL